MEQFKRTLVFTCCLIACYLILDGYGSSRANDDTLAFAVVSESPTDRNLVAAKIAIQGTVSDLKLLASDQILSNPIWKKLEICHALKLEGQKTAEGFRVTTVRAIEAAMLPMVLQGFAGDCLLRKALEIAPFAD